MKNVIIVFVVSLLLFGCADSRLVRKPSFSQYGPVNQTAVGIIKYRSNIAHSAENRKHALKTMYDSCKGKYRIISEVDKNEGAAAMPVGGIMFANAIVWRYIEFECIEGKETKK